MHIVGIDPGITGAVAFLSSWEETWNKKIVDTPQLIVNGKPVYDYEGMAAIFEDFCSWVDCNNAKCYIENVHAMPGQGVTSMFNFGKGFGIWIGILASYQIKTEFIAPQVWKKEIARNTKEKDSFRIIAAEMYPECADMLRRKKDIGRADALMIAEYGRRRNL